MSKTPKKKRKTRLKGTDTMKPCFDCKQTKNRFTAFKPRWAGCVTHRTANGRRYFQQGCADCAALVNGNIRQPRCIECDKARPKKRKKANAAATPKPTPVVEPRTIPEPVAEVAPEPVAEVVGKPEPSPESVTLPEPEPEAPKPKAKPKAKVAQPQTAADILRMLDEGAEDSDSE